MGYMHVTMWPRVCVYVCVCDRVVSGVSIIMAVTLLVGVSFPEEQTLQFSANGPVRTPCGDDSGEQWEVSRDEFSLWISARKAGVANVTVAATLSTAKFGVRVLTGTIAITAIPVLTLLSPQPSTSCTCARECMSGVPSTASVRCARQVLTRLVRRVFSSSDCPSHPCGTPVLLLLPGSSGRLRTTLDSLSTQNYTVLNQPGSPPGIVDVDNSGRFTVSGARSRAPWCGWGNEASAPAYSPQ